MAKTGSPRSIIKEAYAVYPFFDGELWLDMLKDRNDMAHIYDGSAATETGGTHFADIYSTVFKVGRRVKYKIR